MDIDTNLEISKQVVKNMTITLHNEVNKLTQDLLSQITNYQKNSSKYEAFNEAHEAPLFSEMGTRLNEMLKDIKLLRAIKENELSFNPQPNAELLIQKKIPLRGYPSVTHTNEFGSVIKIVRPLTSNPMGYQLIESVDPGTGQSFYFVLDRAEEEVVEGATPLKKGDGTHMTNTTAGGEEKGRGGLKKDSEGSEVSSHRGVGSRRGVPSKNYSKSRNRKKDEKSSSLTRLGKFSAQTDSRGSVKTNKHERRGQKHAMQSKTTPKNDLKNSKSEEEEPPIFGKRYKRGSRDRENDDQAVNQEFYDSWSAKPPHSPSLNERSLQEGEAIVTERSRAGIGHYTRGAMSHQETDFKGSGKENMDILGLGRANETDDYTITPLSSHRRSEVKKNRDIFGSRDYDRLGDFRAPRDSKFKSGETEKLNFDRSSFGTQAKSPVKTKNSTTKKTRKIQENREKTVKEEKRPLNEITKNSSKLLSEVNNGSSSGNLKSNAISENTPQKAENNWSALESSLQTSLNSKLDNSNRKGAAGASGGERRYHYRPQDRERPSGRDPEFGYNRNWRKYYQDEEEARKSRRNLENPEKAEKGTKEGRDRRELRFTKKESPAIEPRFEETQEGSEDSGVLKNSNDILNTGDSRKEIKNDHKYGYKGKDADLDTFKERQAPIGLGREQTKPKEDLKYKDNRKPSPEVVLDKLQEAKKKASYFRKTKPNQNLYGYSSRGSPLNSNSKVSIEHEEVSMKSSLRKSRDQDSHVFKRYQPSHNSLERDSEVPRGLRSSQGHLNEARNGRMIANQRKDYATEVEKNGQKFNSRGRNGRAEKGYYHRSGAQRFSSEVGEDSKYKPQAAYRESFESSADYKRPKHQPEPAPATEFQLKTTPSLAKLNKLNRSPIHPKRVPRLPEASNTDQGSPIPSSILTTLNEDDPRNMKSQEMSKSEFTILLPKNRVLKIYDMMMVSIYNQSGIEVFSDALHIPEVGKTSGKSEEALSFNKDKNKVVFFNHKHQICSIDLVRDEIDPMYFIDDQSRLVDFAIDEMEDRLIILNSQCNIYYKSMVSSYLAEDQSLAGLGELMGKAISISKDGLYLMIGYECFSEQSLFEDNLILRKKSFQSGLYEPYTAAYVSCHTGKIGLF